MDLIVSSTYSNTVMKFLWSIMKATQIQVFNFSIFNKRLFSLIKRLFKECLRRVEKITGKKIESVKMDVNDRDGLRELFKKNTFYACLHLAALKSVGQSVSNPLEYYHNNVSGTISVLTVCSASDS